MSIPQRAMRLIVRRPSPTTELSFYRKAKSFAAECMLALEVRKRIEVDPGAIFPCDYPAVLAGISEFRRTSCSEEAIVNRGFHDLLGIALRSG